MEIQTLKCNDCGLIIEAKVIKSSDTGNEVFIFCPACESAYTDVKVEKGDGR